MRAGARAVGRRDVTAGEDRVGGGSRRAERAVDALAGERIDEAGRIADQQPAGPGGARHAVTDRRGAADRREARDCRRAAWRPRGAPAMAASKRPRGVPAAVGPAAAPSRRSARRRASAPGRRTSPVADVHLAVVGQLGDARVVGHEAEAAREAHRPLDADAAG